MNERAFDRDHLRALRDREVQTFIGSHPKTVELFERSRHLHPAGFHMAWYTEWFPYPVYVSRANGAQFEDVDGNTYFDFCLGHSAALFGHSPEILAESIATTAKSGLTVGLPTEDSLFVSEELTRRFGVGYWQYSLSASDANRWAMRIAREITGRPKVLVFNWCYHGSVDESFITYADGTTSSRPGNVGAPVDPTLTTRVVEWNDTEQLEKALSHGDVALVLTEPALTDMAIVMPEPGFHAALRELTKTYGSYLLLDETHTIQAGCGGLTREWKLQPDFVVLGKPLGGGVPIGAYGMSEEVAHAYEDRIAGRGGPTAGIGIGGSMAGNRLSLAAARITLEKLWTEDAYRVMIPLAQRWAAGAQTAIDRLQIPWHVVQLGTRVCYWFCPMPPRSGAEAAAYGDTDLSRFMHLYALNRGVFLIPFGQNTALMSPCTTPEAVDRHSAVFTEACEELFA